MVSLCLIYEDTLTRLFGHSSKFLGYFRFMQVLHTWFWLICNQNMNQVLTSCGDLGVLLPLVELTYYQVSLMISQVLSSMLCGTELKEQKRHEPFLFVAIGARALTGLVQRVLLTGLCTTWLYTSLHNLIIKKKMQKLHVQVAIQCRTFQLKKSYIKQFLNF